MASEIPFREGVFTVVAHSRTMATVYFGHQGKCAANLRSDSLNMDAPKELLGLDVLHKRSTSRNVEAMQHGRFSMAPRNFFGDAAVARSNESMPSKLFLDPYHVADGNLFAENFLMGRFQRGGQTCLAGHSSMLKMEKERFGKEDMQSRARSKYLEPEGGRFVPPLKPACSRDKGPDPYGTYSHTKWVIANTGYVGGMGSKAKSAPQWSTFALTRPVISQ